MNLVTGATGTNGVALIEELLRRAERVRALVRDPVRAAERFARGESVEAVAGEFRVTVPTVRRWRRQWREGGTEALRSRGRCRSSGSRPANGRVWSRSYGVVRQRTASPTTSGGR